MRLVGGVVWWVVQDIVEMEKSIEKYMDLPKTLIHGRTAGRSHMPSS